MRAYLPGMKGRARSQDPEHDDMSIATELLTAEELAGRLHIRPDTVRSWARRGLIPKVQLSPKVIRFDQAAVVEAMTKQETEKGGAQ